MPTANNIIDITSRGIPLRFLATNGRLGVWARRFDEIEPELLDLIDSLPRQTTFYDIGASIGLFSLYAAKRMGGTVCAFEAEAQNYSVLEYNHFLNREDLGGTLIALNVALSDDAGLGSLHTRKYGAGEHGKTLDRAITQDTKQDFVPEHVQSVLKMPLDELVERCGLPVPNVIKIDVDGAETSVLRGAQRTLAREELHTVFIELSSLSRTTEDEILAAHGFAQTKQVPVVRLSGGFYPDLHNCVFTRER